MEERELLNNSSDASEPEGCSMQWSIHYHVRKLNKPQHTRLRRTFQLAHYIAATAKSFTPYEQFAEFESKHHGVDLGSWYLTRQSCSEIIKFMEDDKRTANITEPLNSGLFNYYNCVMVRAAQKSWTRKNSILLKLV